MSKIHEKIEVMTAWADGAPIEFRHSHAADVVPWARVNPDVEPSWAWDHFEFRVADPEPPQPDVIPWGAIHEQYRFAFRDPDGRIFVTRTRPDLIAETSGGWGLRSPGVRLDNIVSVKAGGLHWAKTLQERPE